MVMARCDVKEPLDLSANAGLIVGIMKKEDPMGNTNRWFVDAGGITHANSLIYFRLIIILFSI